MKKRIIVMMSVAAFLLTVANAGAVQVLLPGALIPKFVDPLPVANDITVVDATSGGTPAYNIHLREFQAQILPSTGVPLAVPAIPPNTPSWVWGYLTDSDNPNPDPSIPGPVRPSYLGPVVVAERGVPASPTYTNELPDNGFVQTYLLPIDQTLDWANPGGDTGPDGCLPDANGNFTNPLCGLLPYAGQLPDSVHIHGGEVPPASDGGPDSWFTQSNATTGIGFSGNTLDYPNGQEEATIWFHPHGFGITRLNVFAGMAGVYAIMDPDKSTACHHAGVSGA